MEIKNPTLNSFKYALDGIVHSLKTQPHMRFHFTMTAIVLIAGILCRLSRVELLVLCFSITLVISAEMLNTAVEAAVDLTTTSFHPLAKYAKDIAAGAVLVTTINALIVGILLFLDKRRFLLLLAEGKFSSKMDPYHYFLAAIMGIILMIVLVVLWKARGGKGSILRGGVISGHSSVAFFLATLIIYMHCSMAIILLALLLALLVAQSRVDARIHTMREVVFGALVGMGTPFLGFTALPALVSMASHLH